MGSGGESLIKSEKTSAYSMFEINKERFGGFWFSVTHPHDLFMFAAFNPRNPSWGISRDHVPKPLRLAGKESFQNQIRIILRFNCVP